MDFKELSKFSNNFKLLKNCEFDFLGMSTSKYNNKKVLCFYNNNKFLESIIENDNIVGVICTKELVDSIYNSKLGIIVTEDPKKEFFRIHNQLCKVNFYWSKFENKISKNSTISSMAYIGDNSIEIGDNCLIEAGVVIHPGTIIGNNVIIRSGTQVGGNGFQFINDGVEVFRVESGGRVVIEDNVEIQHNCCIDRGVLGGDTRLKEYVKVDNLVHIAHDDEIGERSFITAGVKLAGRVIIGKDCWIGVNATISNGIIIGDNCKISLGSVVTKDVKQNNIVTGNFAIEHSKFIEFIKSIR